MTTIENKVRQAVQLDPLIENIEKMPLELFQELIENMTSPLNHELFAERLASEMELDKDKVKEFVSFMQEVSYDSSDVVCKETEMVEVAVTENNSRSQSQQDDDNNNVLDAEANSEEHNNVDPLSNEKEIIVLGLFSEKDDNNLNINASGITETIDESISEKTVDDALQTEPQTDETETNGPCCDGSVTLGGSDVTLAKDDVPKAEKQARKKSIKKAFKGVGKSKRNSVVTNDEGSSHIGENVKKAKSKRWSLFEKKSKNKTKTGNNPDENEAISIVKLTDSPGCSGRNSNIEQSSSDIHQKDPTGNITISNEELKDRPRETSTTDEVATVEKKDTTITLDGETAAVSDASSEQQPPKNMSVDVIKSQDHSEAKLPQSRPSSSAKQKKRRSSWFSRQKKDCAVQKDDDEKKVQEERLQSLQTKLTDLHEEYQKINDVITKEMKEKAKALKETEREKAKLHKTLSNEIEKLKVEIEEHQQELHVCNSTQDILHITAMETSRELEVAEETVCILKKSNEDLQFDLKEDKFFIEQLKGLLAEKEKECQLYKKVLIENLKNVSRTIAGSLRHASETLKKPSEILKSKASSDSKVVEDDDLKNLKQEKNRFAEQVELLSSHNISLEMHIDNLERQLSDAVKLVRLYEYLEAHLKLDDLRYNDLNKEARKLLAFYRAHEGSKNIVTCNMSRDDVYCSLWDESILRLQDAAASDIMEPGTCSALTADQKVTTDAKVKYERRGKKQALVPRHRSHQEFVQHSKNDDNTTSIDVNITANNAGNTSESLPLHRTVTVNDIRHLELTHVDDCHSSENIPAFQSSVPKIGASTCHKTRSILKKHL